VINIAGLSLGLASAMLIILYVKDEISYDRFHKDVGNIYRIVTQEITENGATTNKGSNSGYIQGPRFAANVPGIESFVRIEGGYEDIKTGNEIRRQEELYVDSNFLSVFNFPLLSGNVKTALLQPNSIVLSEDEAKRQFGTTNALGKTVLIKDENKLTPLLVTAVTKRCPQNSSIKFEMLRPEQVDKMNWFSFFLNTFVVVDPHANLKSIEATMQKVYEKDAKDAIKEMAEKYGMKDKLIYSLQPFTDMHLNSELSAQNGLVDGSNSTFSYILSGIAIFILLIACINFVNLTVARSIKRAKEIGIRKVIGGERKQLIVQFLGESFTLCFIAFVLALVIVELILPVFNELSNKALSISYLFDIKLVDGYIALFIVTGLLAGFYPALVLSNYDPVQTLYSRFKLAGKNYLQKSLVVLQFALASFLIIATLTIFSQFNFLTTEKLGYDDSNVVVVDNFKMKRDQIGAFKNELLKNPNIIMVAPRNGGVWRTIGKINGDTQVDFDYETVDESYLPLLRIPVIKGRNFSTDFPSDSSNSVLVNETFVKKAGWREPLGQEVKFYDDKKFTVIGVIRDHHFQALNYKIGSQLFTMKKGNDLGKMLIKIKPGSDKASLQHIERVFKSLFPLNPFSYKFQDLENIQNYEAEAKWKQIILFGAILTIFISCIGLFGLSVLAAEKRTKEIGIRKVLGASVQGVVTILSKDFLKLVFIALLVSMPAAWYFSNRWLLNYAYRIQLGWQMFAMAGSIVLLIALATVSFQAVRTAIANPVKSLRAE
jgi:putative ABC transport system permease protein